MIPVVNKKHSVKMIIFNLIVYGGFGTYFYIYQDYVFGIIFFIGGSASLLLTGIIPLCITLTRRNKDGI